MAFVRFACAFDYPASRRAVLAYRPGLVFVPEAHAVAAIAAEAGERVAREHVPIDERRALAGLGRFRGGRNG